ncbi:MAG: hypothetical protein K6F51_03245 [Acetatifactor sp.]|nr:hypothetical protein [Acetatifactor sp.]
MSFLDFLASQFSKAQKATLVESFQDDLDPSVMFKVVDRKTPFLPLFDVRRLEFQRGSSYSYSAIYLNKHLRLQPIYFAVQRLTESFFPKFSSLESALVLGCAGCSIPRFLALSSKDCKITGVEYSKTMIEIARKYFINDPLYKNFTLLHDDAFSYVHRITVPFQLIYVDLFLAENNCPQITSMEFIHAICSSMAEESIAIFNALCLSKDDCMKFASRHASSFSAAYVFDHQFHYYVVFVKVSSASKLKPFEKRAMNFIRLDERFIAP